MNNILIEIKYATPCPQSDRIILSDDRIFPSTGYIKKKKQGDHRHHSFINMYIIFIVTVHVLRLLARVVILTANKIDIKPKT